MHSDLSMLEAFIETIPQDKIVQPWNERYIDDVQTLNGYNKAKKFASETNRLVDFFENTKDGYPIDLYKESCKISSNTTSDINCSSCCEYNPEQEKCEYDEYKCNRFFAENVHNWSELCGYHILFLQGKTPGTPDHPGPWHKETSYILDPLIKILTYGILTGESQPGLLIYNSDINTTEEYIQKPYLSIKGPAGRIHRILIKLLYSDSDSNSDNMIKYVDHQLQILSFDNYDNYDQNDMEDYVDIMLGIDTPTHLTDEYIRYVFSNKFFDRIADVVSTTR